MKKIIWILLGIAALVVVVIMMSLKFQVQTSDRILLLYPDGTNPSVLEAWKNAAAEEGLHIEILSNNDFIYSKKIRPESEYKGIILADTLQLQMPQVLADHIKSYVKDGGSVLLVFDAATQDSKGNPWKTGSLFSDVLDLNYAVTNKPDDVVTGSGSIGQRKDILNTLGIPPGKCIIVNGNETVASQLADSYCAISSYSYGALTYPYFLTKPMDDTNDLLLTTPDHQFIAGVKKVNKGNILFVNLPLTYLWRNTDAMLLHAFLHYFAVNMLHLPTLSQVPNGVGGLIMNLHTESKDALDAFVILEKWGLFQQGPYSIDFTAGPDLSTWGDKNGLDVLHNSKTQYWIHHLASLGNTIGSDGGWAHNYFGVNVNENNERVFLKYIIMNNDAMEKVLGKKVEEYVPSMGNQPNWATRYLEKAGFLAYYTTSNTGTAPTRNFRDGVFDSPHIWSFPIVPLGMYASIRDCGLANIPAELLTQWFVDSTDFVAAKHVSRLIYYHPTDILFYPQYLYSIQAWLLKAKQLSSAGSYHWYSMLDMAEFLDSRRAVTWSVKRKNELQLFSATHPDSLEHQAWLIEKNRCDQPKITMGTGLVNQDRTSWIVVAGNTQHFEFQCKLLATNQARVQPEVMKKQEYTSSSLLPSPPFKWRNTGLITLWFDDASMSEFTNALPNLVNYGYKGAVSIAVNNVGKPGFMTWHELLTLQSQGFETTSHTLSNSCNFSYYTTETTEAELHKSKEIIMQHGLRANQFVMPCGYSRDQIADHFIDKHPPIVETAKKYYSSFRTLVSKRNNQLPLQDTYNLKAFQVTRATTNTDIQSRIDQAVNEKSWLILVFQEIQDGEGTSSISLTRFKSILELVKNSHLPVVLPDQVIK